MNVGAYAITQGTLALSSNYALTYVARQPDDQGASGHGHGQRVEQDLRQRQPGSDLHGHGGQSGQRRRLHRALTRTIAGVNVGAYAITQGTLALSSNYALTYVGADLTIDARAVTVTANALSKTYGNANPALTYTVTAGNLVGSDAFTGSLSQRPLARTSAITRSRKAAWPSAATTP